MAKIIATICILGILLCGCTAPVKQQGQYYRFTDSMGNTVCLSAPPQRVAVLFSSFAEIWTLSGGSVAITVGESVERGFVGEDVILVDAGAGKSINHEQLLAAHPDLVISSADIAAQADTCKLLTDVGIPCALFRVDTFEDYLSMLKICTQITGNDDAYEKYGVQVQSQISQVMDPLQTANLPKKKILFIRAGSQYSATKAKRAPDNFVCTMLDQLGAENIADGAAMLLDGLSLEEILLQNPDHIFLTTMGDEAAAKAYIKDLFSQEGWNQLQAVQAGNYTFLDKNLFHFKPNARWAEAYEILADLLYPELNMHG